MRLINPIGYLAVATIGAFMPFSANGKVDYVTQIKPILSTKCYSCHGALKQKAKLRLETRTLMLKGEVIVPGKAEESLLIEKILDEGDDRMPPPEEGASVVIVKEFKQWHVLLASTCRETNASILP